MALLVSSEAWGLRKTFETTRKDAGVRFLSCVYSQVRSEVKVKTESFAANFATIQLLSLVKQSQCEQDCAVSIYYCRENSYRTLALGS